MKYFIYAMFFILSITALKAQYFFLPDVAFSSPKEKLRPLSKEAEELTSSFSQRRYRVVNGRVFALPNEVDFQEENESQELIDNSINTELPLQPDSFETIEQNTDSKLTNQDIETTTSVPTISEIKEEIKKPKVNPPKIASLDEKLPLYKNRYALYLKDLEIFQTTGKMPKNKDLSLTIEKLSKPYEVILFQGKIN